MADPKTSVVITAKDETAAGFASAEAGLQRLTGQFISLTNPVAAAATAIAVALAATVGSVKAAVDAGDQFNKLSQKTGIAVEALSGLAYAATLSDVSIESLATGIKKLSVNMNEAAVSTSGKAAEAFKALGVAVKDSSGNLRGSDDVLADIADRFAGMKDGAGKTALAVALFGKAGADLIPFLNQGGKGIAELTAEAEKLGLVLTGKTAKAAEEFNDNMKKLSLSTAALGRSITAELIGPLAEYTRLMVEARKEGASLFGALAIGLRHGDLDKAPLDDLRERAGVLMGTVQRLESGGVGKTYSPVFSEKLTAAKAELAVLQKVIAARLKAAGDFGPPVAPAEKAEAPTFGGKDGTDKESAYLAGLRTQLNAASGDVSEYSKQLTAVTSGSAKDFSQATKNAALALATKIDRLKEATKANEDHAKVLEKVARIEDAANKAVGDFGFKQDQNVAGINARADSLGKTPQEIKQSEAARAIEKDYEDAVKKVNEELGKIGDIEGISAKTYELTQKRDKAHAATAVALDAEKAKQDALNASWEYGADTALRKYQEEITNVAATVESATMRAFKGMEDALVNFVKTGKLDFKSLADSIITDLIRIEVQRSIMKPLTSMMDEAGGLGGLVKSFFGGGKAGGGAIDASKWYVVGENGPELFAPGQSGTVIPNGAVVGGSGGGSVVIHQTVNVDSRSDQASIMQAMIAAKNAAVSAVFNAQRRGATI
jgi:lambda family phage tail tape measure protein